MRTTKGAIGRDTKTHRPQSLGAMLNSPAIGTPNPLNVLLNSGAHF